MNFKLYIKLLALLLVTKCSLNTKINFATKNSAISIVDTNSKITLVTPLTISGGSFIVKDNSSNTISGSNQITFYDSILTTSNVVSFINATFDPTTTDSITLNNNDYLNVTSGSFVQSINIAANATTTIFGQPKFTSAITLAASTSILQLDITTTLNQSITGSGKIRLLNDLLVDKNIQVPALCELMTKRLSFIGGSLTNSVTITTGGSIEFLGYTNLTQAWTIGTTGESYAIIGNGNTLELSGSGSLTFNGSDLTISNLIIKGLSSTNQLKGTGEIKLTNVTLALSSNITRNDGKFTVIGGNCKMITNGYTLTMSGAGNDFKVDGSFFLYEQLNTSITTTPVLTASGANITKLNSGDIVSEQAASSGGGGSGGGSSVGSIATTITNASNTLNLSYFITPSSTFQINNATPATPFAVSIDGGGHFLQFPYGTGSYFVLQDNVQLTLSNILLQNFNPAAISLGTSSTISFGDNTRIELGPDVTIGSGNMAWNFIGNAEIDGNGSTLTLNLSQAITINNTKTLTLKNMRIIVSQVDAIKALSDNSKIKFQNVELVILNQGFTFSQGSIDIADLVKILSDIGSSTSNVNFEFASKGLFTVLASGELFIGNSLNFKYNPNTTADGGVTSVSKRHFVLTQIGSKLTISGGSIESTTFGIALDQGSLQIYDRVTITTTTGATASFDIGTNLQTNIMTSACLNINGIVTYKE